MLWLATLLFLSPSQSPWAEGKNAVTISLGNKTPYFDECFDNAADGASTYEALAPCDRSLDEEPLSERKTAILHANRGVIYFHIGEYEAAADDFTDSLNHGIHVQAKIFANRGLSYEALHYEGLARSDYEAALAINPANEMAQHRLSELDKPLYDRDRLPRKIEAGTTFSPSAGI